LRSSIEALAPDGRLSARLDNKRQVDFDGKEHRQFDYGYAVTSYSSQTPHLPWASGQVLKAHLRTISGRKGV
jgi:hypothetical protein